MTGVQTRPRRIPASMVRQIKPNPPGFPWNKRVRVYHATASVDAIRESGGLKSRRELGQDVHVTGGGHDASISFTLDERVAEAICIGIWSLARAARGDINAIDIAKEFRNVCPESEATRKDIEISYLFTDYGQSEATGEIFSAVHSEEVNVIRSVGIEPLERRSYKSVFPRKETVRALLIAGHGDLAQEVTIAPYRLAMSTYKRLCSHGQFEDKIYDPFFINTDQSLFSSFSRDDIGVLEAFLWAEYVCTDPRSARDMGFEVPSHLWSAFHDWSFACDKHLNLKSTKDDDDWNRYGNIPKLYSDEPRPDNTISYLRPMSEVRVYDSKLIKDLKWTKDMDYICLKTKRLWGKRGVNLDTEDPIFYPYFENYTPFLAK